MDIVPTQIEIEENLKKQSMEIFSNLGLDMSSAVNIFLRQCVLRGGIPFDVVIPNDKYEAIKEANRFSINSKKYDSFSAMVEDTD